eukprot:TRINITY_DN8903_c0_g1_i1.p1 TRINITY_DN8903_c0_g1~~TRINITY_DN8903_c0_g1_i1.p1  ORF type:complete len:173 (-),score=6.98 TRINITY_DN8903_c0_g1_i1:52-570(-)
MDNQILSRGIELAEAMSMPMPPDTGSSSMNMGGGMEMYFYQSTNVTVLFSWWQTTTIFEYVITLLICFLLAVIYEALSSLRLSHRKWCQMSGESFQPLNGGQPNPPRTTIVQQFQYAFLYALQVALAYFIMLIVMTYNYGLCGAVILGYFVGYLCFAWNRDVSEGAGCHGQS